MVFENFKRLIHILTFLTPNWLIPEAGMRITCGKIKRPDWAEIYLLTRFLFAIALATIIPKSLFLVWVVAFIQISSLIYLLKIIFPKDERGLKDPERSLFFAIGHYLEIGLSMAFVYWCLGGFNVGQLTRPDAIYFSFMAMITVGFGDIFPTDENLRILVTAHVVIGLFMLATVIGLFLSLSAGKGMAKEK